MLYAGHTFSMTKFKVEKTGAMCATCSASVRKRIRHAWEGHRELSWKPSHDARGHCQCGKQRTLFRRKSGRLGTLGRQVDVVAVRRNLCGRCWREDHEEAPLRSIFGGRAREWGAASGKRRPGTRSRPSAGECIFKTLPPSKH